MITMRKATEYDIPLILDLIKDLARYEKLLDNVCASENDLKNHIFGENKFVDVLIAEYNSLPAGFALFFQNFSTFLGKPGIYLEDLFVKEEFRGKGVGKTLLCEIAKIAVNRGCGRFEWSVLNWNPAREFYEYLGAKAMDDWLLYRISGDDLNNLAK